eukprot:3014261-Pleurochrysis_carterae.AAC.2
MQASSHGRVACPFQPCQTGASTFESTQAFGIAPPGVYACAADSVRAPRPRSEVFVCRRDGEVLALHRVTRTWGMRRRRCCEDDSTVAEWQLLAAFWQHQTGRDKGIRVRTVRAVLQWRRCLG